jgi:hypothetical protein
MEAKGERSARAAPARGVRKKRGGKTRADGQEPDKRRRRTDERAYDRKVQIHQVLTA